jgi:hypothetical protein
MCSEWLSEQTARVILGPKMNDVIEVWRRLYNEELYDLYCLPNIIRVIKRRIMKWADHVARMGTRKVHAKFWWGNLREGDHLEGTGINTKVILKWVFKKWS